MVSQVASDAPSRDRLVSAATLEFAARGFDGAKVDRITRRARVNKAMLYYHFKNKAALYRAILDDLFGTVAGAVTEGRRAGGSPQDQIRRFIRTIAAETAMRPHFPPIWLREMAEGGRHLDAAILGNLGAIVGVLAGILKEGRRDGVFGDAHPLVTQMAIVAPLLLFTASAPIRKRLPGAVPSGAGRATREALVAHVERATLAALAVGASRSPRASRPRRQRR